MNVKKLIKYYPYKWYLNLRGYFIYYKQKIFFPSNSSTFLATLYQGIYERDVLALILANYKKDSYFFDIGTNIGTISVPVLASLPDAKVISFEASPNTLPYLKKTFNASSFKDRWIIIDKAVSNKEGYVNFALSSKKNGAYESMADTKRVSLEKTVKIEAITIDAIWEKLGQPKVSVIKCDIEGGDLLAMEGALNCIKQFRPIIIIEWNKTNIKAFGITEYDFFNLLQKINYQIYSIPFLVPINTIDEFHVHQAFSEMYLLNYKN